MIKLNVSAQAVIVLDYKSYFKVIFTLVLRLSCKYILRSTVLLIFVFPNLELNSNLISRLVYYNF